MDTGLLLGGCIPLDRDDEPFGSDNVVRDLELTRVFEHMSGGDDLIERVSRAAILHPLTDGDQIRWRQAAVRDCVRNEDAVRAMYALAGRALDVPRSRFMPMFARRPGAVLNRAHHLLSALGGHLDELRRLTAECGDGFSSAAFTGFTNVVQKQLDEDYMQAYREQVRQLELRAGLGTRVRLGPAAEILPDQLHHVRKGSWNPISRLTNPEPSFSFTIPDRDEAGAQATQDLRDRTVLDAALVTHRAAEDVLAFFAEIRTATAFYLGAANLVDELGQLGCDTVMPDLSEQSGEQALDGLYDPSLALRIGRRPELNDVDLAGNPLLVITGANQAGKSTTLRALGTAQLLAQCGLPVPATAARIRLAGQVFTHWAREEDAGLVHGKFDEELQRISDIVRHLRPGDLLLSNESFAATNEAERSAIAAEVIRALVDAGVHLYCVTHLFTFANDLWEHDQDRARFLRAIAASQTTSGTTPFRLVEAAPQPTSHGVEVFNRTFRTTLQTGRQP